MSVQNRPQFVYPIDTEAPRPGGSIAAENSWAAYKTKSPNALTLYDCLAKFNKHFSKPDKLITEDQGIRAQTLLTGVAQSIPLSFQGGPVELKKLKEYSQSIRAMKVFVFTHGNKLQKLEMLKENLDIAEKNIAIECLDKLYNSELEDSTISKDDKSEYAKVLYDCREGLSFPGGFSTLEDCTTHCLHLKNLRDENPNLKAQLGGVYEFLEEQLRAYESKKTFDEVKPPFNRVLQELSTPGAKDLRFKHGEFRTVARNWFVAFLESVFGWTGRSEKSKKAADTLLTNLETIIKHFGEEGGDQKKLLQDFLLPLHKNTWFQGVLQHHKEIQVRFSKLNEPIVEELLRSLVEGPLKGIDNSDNCLIQMSLEEFIETRSLVEDVRFAASSSNLDVSVDDCATILACFEEKEPFKLVQKTEEITERIARLNKNEIDVSEVDEIRTSIKTLIELFGEKKAAELGLTETELTASLDSRLAELAEVNKHLEAWKLFETSSSFPVTESNAAGFIETLTSLANYFSEVQNEQRIQEEEERGLIASISARLQAFDSVQIGSVLGEELMPAFTGLKEQFKCLASASEDCDLEDPAPQGEVVPAPQVV